MTQILLEKSRVEKYDWIVSGLTELKESSTRDQKLNNDDK